MLCESKRVVASREVLPIVTAFLTYHDDHVTFTTVYN